MDKLLGLEIPWLVAFVISAALWVIGFLAKMVFDACLRAIEPREATARLLAILRDPTQFVLDGNEAQHKTAKVKIFGFDSGPSIYVNGALATATLTKRERRRVEDAASRVLEHLRARAALKNLDDAGV